MSKWQNGFQVYVQRLDNIKHAKPYHRQDATDYLDLEELTDG